MLKVLKQYLPISYSEEMHFPGFDGFLSVKEQHGQPVLYFQYNPELPTRTITVYTVLTGKLVDLDNTYVYLGTAMLEEDRFVVHYYAK